MSRGGDRLESWKGFLWGCAGIAGTWGFLFLLDLLVQASLDRPLFTRPHTMGLLVLATTIILFRVQIKKGDFEAGKGFFLAIFISTIAYLFYHKFNQGS